MLANIITSVVAELNRGRVKPIPSAIGEDQLDANTLPPRLVWVPSTDTFGPAESVGRGQLRTRLAGCFCRVWGRDFAEAESLLNDLIVAVHAVSVGSYQLGNADWLTKGSATTLGAACDLDLIFSVPVTARQTTRAITATESTVVSEPGETDPVIVASAAVAP